MRKEEKFRMIHCKLGDFLKEEKGMDTFETFREEMKKLCDFYDVSLSEFLEWVSKIGSENIKCWD